MFGPPKSVQNLVMRNEQVRQRCFLKLQVNANKCRKLTMTKQGHYEDDEEKEKEEKIDRVKETSRMKVKK